MSGAHDNGSGLTIDMGSVPIIKIVKRDGTEMELLADRLMSEFEREGGHLRENQNVLIDILDRVTERLVGEPIGPVASLAAYRYARERVSAFMDRFQLSAASQPPSEEASDNTST